MRNKNRNSRVFVTSIALLALAVSACTSSTEPQLTLEDLIAQLQIQLTSTNTGGSASAATTEGRPSPTAGQSPAFTTEPSTSQFQVIGPVTNVFQPTWPVIADIPISASWQGDVNITNSYPFIPRDQWPDLEVAGGVRFGNMWVVYPSGGDPNNWVAQHGEWLRSPHERTGTTYHLKEKWVAPRACNDCPIGMFIAGPSRHVSDNPQYRRRTVIKWFRYGDLSPWVWQNSAGPGPGPGPVEAPELTEAHVYITGFSTELEGGTQIDFPVEIGDVDLLKLVGQPLRVVDSEVPRGTFKHVRFNLDPSRSYVMYGGERQDLVLGEPNVTVLGPFAVGDGPITMVTLEFDIEASLSDNGDGTWTLAPVVVIIVTTG